MLGHFTHRGHAAPWLPLFPGGGSFQYWFIAVGEGVLQQPCFLNSMGVSSFRAGTDEDHLECPCLVESPPPLSCEQLLQDVEVDFCHRTRGHQKETTRWRFGLERWFRSEEYLLFLQKPGISSRHPHGSSQMSVTPVPEGPIHSSDVFRHQAHT